MKKSEDLKELEGISLLTRYTMALLLRGVSRSFLPFVANCCEGSVERLEDVGTRRLQ